MFSIIIPVGLGRDAHQALTSLRGAGLDAADEVIVVGDGHSVKLNEAYQTLPMRVASTGEAQGANAARNLGVRLAKGDIICFLDDDDQYQQGALNRLRQVISKGSGSDVWSLGWHFLSGRKSRSNQRPSILSESTIWKRNIAGGCSSMVMRKATFMTVDGFDDAMASMQDWDLWIRLSRISSIVTLKQSLIIYNDSDTPRISTNQSARISGLTRLLGKNDAHWPKSVIAFHRARLASLKFRSKEGSWGDIFQVRAPIASSLYSIQALRHQ